MRRLPVPLGAEDALGAGETSVFLRDTRGDAIHERHYLQAPQGDVAGGDNRTCLAQPDVGSFSLWVHDAMTR